MVRSFRRANVHAWYMDGRTDGRTDSSAKLRERVRDNDVSPGAFRVRINGVRWKRQTKLFIRSSRGRLLTAGRRRAITSRGGARRPSRAPAEVQTQSTALYSALKKNSQTKRTRHGETNRRPRERPDRPTGTREQVFVFERGPSRARFRLRSSTKSYE